MCFEGFLFLFHKLQGYIDWKAGRQIELLHVERLNREYSKWGSVAIELSDENYALLSQPDFWEKDVLTRPWKGWRFWRSTRPKPLTQQEIKSSLPLQCK